jgi:hypothetical protein
VAPCRFTTDTSRAQCWIGRIAPMTSNASYVFAIFGSYLWGRWVVHPSKAGFATRKVGYLAGLRANSAA